MTHSGTPSSLIPNVNNHTRHSACSPYSQKHLTDNKISGIFTHDIRHDKSKLIEGIGNGFYLPHSRYAFRKEDEIPPAPAIAASSQAAGQTILTNDRRNEYFICGHGEYRLQTPDKEYIRDLKKRAKSHYSRKLFSR